MSETPMTQEQLAEIQRRRAAVADAPWGSCRDLDGAYTVQAGALVGSAGFDSSGDVAQVIAETEEQAYQRASFIARAPGDVDALLTEVGRLRAEVEGLHRCVNEQMETIQEAALAYAERGDELRSLRAELAGAEWAVRTVRRMADDAEQGEQEPGSPMPLRWGLDDAEVGDDDSVALWLSGPAGEPYVLELDVDRARALWKVADWSA